MKESPALLAARRQYSSSWSVCEYLSVVRKLDGVLSPKLRLADRLRKSAI